MTSVRIILVLLLSVSAATAQSLAFPGAMGFGAWASGGRGGTVYTVTTTNDSGAGSFREAALAEGPRTILFSVSGTITLNTTLVLAAVNSDLTIYGGNAPNGGVCFSGRKIILNGATNVIVRYIRSRVGDNPDAWNDDSFTVIGGSSNIIIDHCSFSWSADEVFSFYSATNLTVQNCLISEGLYNAGHEEGPKSYGSLVGGSKSSVLRNAWVHNRGRNPAFTHLGQEADFRNNVIYNFVGSGPSLGANGVWNIEQNYIRYGPATPEDNKYRIYVGPSYTGPNDVYMTNNYVYGSPAITADNVSGAHNTEYVTWHTSPVASTYYPEELSALDAYAYVTNNVGAILPMRDSVDTRVVAELMTGTATYGGLWGAGLGIIDSQDTVGGWPDLTVGGSAYPTDSDGDGMSDAWEMSTFGNLDNDGTGNVLDANYTDLEVYLYDIDTPSPEPPPYPVFDTRATLRGRVNIGGQWQ